MNRSGTRTIQILQKFFVPCQVNAWIEPADPIKTLESIIFLNEFIRNNSQYVLSFIGFRLP